MANRFCVWNLVFTTQYSRVVHGWYVLRLEPRLHDPILTRGPWLVCSVPVSFLPTPILTCWSMAGRFCVWILVFTTQRGLVTTMVAMPAPAAAVMCTAGVGAAETPAYNMAVKSV